MNRLLTLILLAAAALSTVGFSQSYTTSFEGTENPLSEGGSWTNHGIDWTQITKKGRIACGTQTGTNTGKYKFDDSFAHLSGFLADQEAWGEVCIKRPDSSFNQELEILLRWNSSSHRTTGYECFARCLNSDSSYLQIVRWDGPLGKFTYLADKRGTNYGLKNGDTLKASVVGNVITVYINGIEKARVKDDTFKTGNPGIGEFLACNNGKGIGSNSDFGFSSFTARSFGGISGAQTNDAGQTPLTGPLRASRNPNYFEDGSGRPLILCGSQTWNTLQDWGSAGSVQPLDFDAFISFLKAHGHNFTLLWRTELPKFGNLPVTPTHPPDFTVSPHPWMRVGPGLATDGGLRFDLTKFDPAYFERLRRRAEALNRAGIYAGVYLFTGEWVLRFRCPTDGYPFSAPNNVNGVDDGYRGGPAESGLASVTMTGTNLITDLQDAYVRKTIDTLNDLPNVLWIVSEEAPTKSTWWNNHWISLVRAYERGKPSQHPVGYATLESPSDSILYDSDADWVAPGAWTSPANSCGSGNPRCKVNINDSDHSYFGMWNDPPQKNRNYAWENFTTGNQVLFMDPYLVDYPRENRNLCPSPVNGIGTQPDPRWDSFRNNLGYLLQYSRKLNLANVTPRSSLCSTKYCLAQTPPVGAEYLAYAPDGGAFTMDLSAMPSSRRLAVEWFNPADGATITENSIAAGSSSQSFSPPFSGDAVLFLVDTTGHK
ncbi:MAG TPA: DUF6298 domain-containing protein [Verrucomicrobiae bacterium]|nr:DUF6298 domain-containing protein [Verrucomicrobiae bacterium]